MFKHILLPIDGSALAVKGARAGVRLAKALGARVSAVAIEEMDGEFSSFELHSTV